MRQADGTARETFRVIHNRKQEKRGMILTLFCLLIMPSHSTRKLQLPFPSYVRRISSHAVMQSCHTVMQSCHAVMSCSHAVMSCSHAVMHSCSHESNRNFWMHMRGGGVYFLTQVLESGVDWSGWKIPPFHPRNDI